MRIAVDAVGGDYAPHNVLAGALDALRDTGNRFEVLFVGPEDMVRSGLAKIEHNGLAYQIVNATQVIDMQDSATAALKQKKDSSIAVGITLHKEGRADAFVSAGHTGAVMSASTLILGRIEGVSRPTIGAFLPTENGVCLLVDAGANVDCKSQHLYQFAVMGSIYSQKMLHLQNPSVGLLSIGEESSKGNDATLEAHKLLSQSKLNFIGNVEGRDILKGKANVVVCDGFVGNVVLKFAESVLDLLKTKIRRYAAHGIMQKAWAGMMAGTLRSILKDFDYQEYGGVPLLGVNGVSIIGHGKSTPKAIKNMILKAEDMVRKNINRSIRETLQTVRGL
ncbi:MAG: phosphate acyltransferase PlsX [Ignavibacteriae bacterium]|nr:phosphate acyltransferase PlsX [Ignavibacteria bacterium]MBI3364383.1 phosphate acyltransferase PlsX [Ignavibacteriota bacterium]